MGTGACTLKVTHLGLEGIKLVDRFLQCRRIMPLHQERREGVFSQDGGARNNHQGDLAGPSAIHLQIRRKQSGEKDLLSHYDTNPVTFFSLDASLPGYTELVCTGTSACITR